jgi:hypothetical protein
MAINFKAKINIREGNPYILINPKRAASLNSGWKKPMPVLIKINNKPDKAWRINMMPVGDGGFYLYLHGDVRKASNTKVGDLVTVSIRFDKDYKSGPVHPLPDWFQIRLEKNLKAQTAWKNLTPGRQKEMLRYFYILKTGEAKHRNAEKAISVLSGKSGRVAQSWSEGKVVVNFKMKNTVLKGTDKLHFVEKEFIAILKKQGEMSLKDLIDKLETLYAGKFEGSIRYYAITAKLSLQNKEVIQQQKSKLLILNKKFL